MSTICVIQSTGSYTLVRGRAPGRIYRLRHCRRPLTVELRKVCVCVCSSDTFLPFRIQRFLAPKTEQNLTEQKLSGFAFFPTEGEQQAATGSVDS